MAQEVIDEFLGIEIDLLNSFTSGKIELNREQLQNSLNAINNIIIGMLNYIWQTFRFHGQFAALLENRFFIEFNILGDSCQIRIFS